MSGPGSFASSHQSRTSAFVCTSRGCAASSSARSSVTRWSSVAIGLRRADADTANPYRTVRLIAKIWEMSERRKALSRVAFEVWGTGELDRLDETVAPHAVHH